MRRAALVPKIQPSQRNGQPMGNAVSEVSAGTAGLVSLTEPGEVEEANAGIAVPRSQVNAAARLKVAPNFDLGLLWDHGFDEGSIAISDDQPDPEGDVYGAGLSTYYSAETVDPRFRVGVGLDLLFYSVPYVEYRNCIENCFGERFTEVDHDRDTIPVLSAALIPSYRLSPKWTVFGGVTMRNHPTIPKEDIEGSIDFEEEVESGPFNYLVSAGIEREIFGRVRAMLVLYQPVVANPVRYGPTIGLNVTLPLGRRDPPPGQRQPPLTAAR